MRGEGIGSQQEWGGTRVPFHSIYVRMMCDDVKSNKSFVFKRVSQQHQAVELHLSKPRGLVREGASSAAPFRPGERQTSYNCFDRLYQHPALRLAFAMIWNTLLNGEKLTPVQCLAYY